MGRHQRSDITKAVAGRAQAKAAIAATKRAAKEAAANAAEQDATDAQAAADLRRQLDEQDRK